MSGIEPTADRLRRQRDVLAEIGGCALRTDSLDALLEEACRLVAGGLDTAFCKVLEYRTDLPGLLVRAGVGWKPGVVGHAVLDADSGSPAGFALQTGAPVISNDLANETRFRTPALLLEHGIARAVNVIMRGDGMTFGVLEVDSSRVGAFTADDSAFLQAAANLLGIAIERRRRQTELQAALERYDVLMREADHRIKNSLQLTASLLTLQRSRLADAEAGAALDDAINRVQAVAATHRALHESADLHTVAFGRMLDELCRHVSRLSSGIAIDAQVDPDMPLDTERAIPLGLIVSEVLTNAVRHAYKPGQEGHVELRAALRDPWIEIVVLDGGSGFAPADDRPSLGTTIVRVLARQIGAELHVESAPQRGTTVTVRLPRTPPGTVLPGG